MARQDRALLTRQRLLAGWRLPVEADPNLQAKMLFQQMFEFWILDEPQPLLFTGIRPGLPLRGALCTFHCLLGAASRSLDLPPFPDEVLTLPFLRAQELRPQ
ncbi:hypothetical protein BBK14_15110 [Parafrankia soli]|uniref:Uncharacterized protein n=1 Tax=Parafrankia soli TaxID=2599596 RepID=A0A1S1QNI6_9ACTN|nr:hypothetical protein [Parafrankia soli]OHV35550.1 hypothetical protein BBK14_15110 [Parafrankia soli]